jgi:hypothetical protein
VSDDHWFLIPMNHNPVVYIESRYDSWEAKKRGQQVLTPAFPTKAHCSCSNWDMVSALGKLMANHWTSEPNTAKRQQQIIQAISTATVMLGADINGGKIEVTVGPDGTWTPPSWYDSESEKMMSICTACYRHLLALPAQLPPEQTDLTVREFETILSEPQPDIFFYMRSAARQICEWLITPW